MAVDGYIKAAHSQLTTAVTVLQGEINELQRDLQNRKQNLEHDVSKLSNEVKMHQVGVAQKSDDDSEKTFLLSRIDSLSHERDQKASEIQQAEQQIVAAIQAKNQALSAIQSMSGSVNGLLSSPGVK